MKYSLTFNTREEQEIAEKTLEVNETNNRLWSENSRLQSDLFMLQHEAEQNETYKKRIDQLEGNVSDWKHSVESNTRARKIAESKLSSVETELVAAYAKNRKLRKWKFLFYGMFAIYIIQYILFLIQ